MTRKLTLTAMLIALTVIFLIASAIAPTGRLSLFFLSTVTIVIVVLTSGVKYAAAAYIASSLLCFILYPGNLSVVAFALFFGYYSIVKLFIERIKRLPVEWVLKLVIFNIALMVVPFIFKNIPLYAYAAAEAAFVVYDLLLSYMIGYISHRFAEFIKH